MTLAQSAARSVGNTAIGVALLVLVALIWLGLAAPTGIHPFFYFGLIFLGGGAVGLLFAGVGVMAVRSRVPTTADLRFFQGIRRLVLAIAGGQGSTPLGASTLTVAFATAAVTVICAGITSTVMRRVLPTA